LNGHTATLEFDRHLRTRAATNSAELAVDRSLCRWAGAEARRFVGVRVVDHRRRPAPISATESVETSHGVVYERGAHGEQFETVSMASCGRPRSAGSRSG